MRDNLRFLLVLGIFLTLVAVLLIVGGYGVFHALEPDQQRALISILAPHGELIAEIGLLVLAILGIAFTMAYQVYVKGALKVAEGIRITLNANPGHRLATVGPAELRSLAQAVNEMAERGELLAQDLEAKVAQAKASVEEEKNRLAALMSELSQGVLVCNADGRILLYNERARYALLGSSDLSSAGTAALIGLGRSIFAIVERNLLAHALETMRARLEKNEADPIAQFVFTTRTGEFIRVRMALVLGATKAASAPADGQTDSDGFVMTLENITETFEVDTTRDMLLQSLTEGSRAALANIRAAVETLTAVSYTHLTLPTSDLV